MNRNTRIPLPPGLLLLTALCLCDAGAQEVAGQLIRVHGDVTLIGVDGKRGAADPQSPIHSGDRLLTADYSHAQIRFRDGALMSIRPNTELRLDAYAFNGRQDGSERAHFSLVSGGFRTITGLIGKRNKRNYRVTTPMATLHIRGTHYGIRLCAPWECRVTEENRADPGMYVEVKQGATVVSNGAGEHLFRAGQHFHIANQASAAVEQLAPYGFVFDTYRPRPVITATEEAVTLTLDDATTPSPPAETEPETTPVPVEKRPLEQQFVE